MSGPSTPSKVLLLNRSSTPSLITLWRGAVRRQVEPGYGHTHAGRYERHAIRAVSPHHTRLIYLHLNLSPTSTVRGQINKCAVTCTGPLQLIDQQVTFAVVCCEHRKWQDILGRHKSSAVWRCCRVGGRAGVVVDNGIAPIESCQ